MQPLMRVWIWSPPNSSLVISMPSAAFTTGGPPGKIWLMCFTITLKCARQALTAGRPATDPSTAETVGTRDRTRTSWTLNAFPSGR